MDEAQNTYMYGQLDDSHFTNSQVPGKDILKFYKLLRVLNPHQTTKDILKEIQTVLEFIEN